MQTTSFITAVLVPPLGARLYGCGTHCLAPVAVFWLFGVLSVVYGFFGGPAGEAGISWWTIALGLVMWLIAAVWTLLTLQGVEADINQDEQSPRAHFVEPTESETDPFDEIKKAH